MTWEELLDAFRALGGVAENVRLGEGPYGRGIFVNDPHKPAKLWAPSSMFIRIDDIIAQDSDMAVRGDGYDPRVRTFFERYQAHYGWGAGGHEASAAMQAAWHALPASIVAAIQATGALDRPQERFSASNAELALREYLCTRQFSHNDSRYAVPMIDLVNHSAHGYTLGGGYGVEGTFADEMLVSYAPTDAWTKVVNYGFAATATIAHSVGVTVGLPGGRALSIGRNILNFTIENNLRMPALRCEGNEVLLSHLVLGLESGKDLPRAIFYKVMDRAGVPQADAVFDSIARYNRLQFTSLLRLLRACDGSLARALEDGILNQLDALSACVGTRSL
jgi:hypothetical protein